MRRWAQNFNLFHMLLVAVIVACAARANAAERAPVTEVLRFTNTASTNDFNLLEQVALNAAAGTRTVTLTTGRRWPTLRVSVFFTHSAATTVTMVTSCSMDGTNYATVQAGALSGGTRTLTDLTDSKPVSGNTNFHFSVGVKTCEKVQLLFGGASAGANDKVNVQVSGVAGQ